MSGDTLTAEKLVTAEELALMPDGECRLELVAGRVISVPPAGGEHGVIGVEVVAALADEARKTKGGRATGADTGYILSHNPDTVRVPDGGFISVERLPEGKAPKGFIEGAPDLAVEVVSPSDTWSEVEAKVRDYLNAGSRLVWVIDPELRVARVFRQDGTATFVSEGGILSGEGVLPGFELPLSQVFG